jgi:cell shape-determining protein MreD
MKPRVYLIIALLVIPVQASLFRPISLFGIKPDLPLALIYIIGLLTGPIEGALAGIGIGLVQDISSAGLIGLAGITRGLFGLLAGFLGQQVLDIASPANIIFLSAFCLLEGIALSLFIGVTYGSLPFISLLFTRLLPRAFYTGLLGTLMLQIIKDRKVAALLLRRSLQKE